MSRRCSLVRCFLEEIRRGFLETLSLGLVPFLRHFGSCVYGGRSRSSLGLLCLGGRLVGLITTQVRIVEIAKQI